MMGGQDLLNKDELTIKVMFGFQKVLRNIYIYIYFHPLLYDRKYKKINIIKIYKKLIFLMI